MRQLLIGCGHNKRKQMGGVGEEVWDDLVTLDMNPDVKPEIKWDLSDIPLPFDDNEFDEIHAYHVLEHVGAQGDWRFFFSQWTDFHRILKPGGWFFGAVPHWQDVWALADPSHTRVLPLAVLTFLCQEEYAKQAGNTAMSDFRFVYKADFKIVSAIEDAGKGESRFILRARK